MHFLSWNKRTQILYNKLLTLQKAMLCEERVNHCLVPGGNSNPQVHLSRGKLMKLFTHLEWCLFRLEFFWQ